MGSQNKGKILCCSTDPAWYSASSCILQGESAGIAQVREIELSLMCQNKFSSVIFPVCPFSLPKGISKHQGCSLLQLCSAVRMGFPTGSGLQAELSFWEKQRCFDFRDTLVLGAQLDPVQRDDLALLGKRKSTNVLSISGLLHAFQFWFLPCGCPNSHLG